MLSQFIQSLDPLGSGPIEYFSLPLDQPIITQTNNNNDNQLQTLSYEDILRQSLGWRYAV